MSVQAAQLVILGAIGIVIVGFLLLLIVFGTNITSSIASIATLLAGAFGSVFDTFLSITQFLVNSLTQFASYLATTFDTFIVKATNGMKSVSDFFTNQLTGIVNGVVRMVITIGSTIGRYVMETFFNVTFGAQSLSNAYTSMTNSIFTTMSSLIMQGITIIFNLISNAIYEGIGLISFTFTFLIDILASGIFIAVDAILTGVALAETGLELLEQAFQDAWSQLLTQLNNIYYQILQARCTLMETANTATCALCSVIPGVNCCFCSNTPGCNPYCQVCPVFNTNPPTWGSCSTPCPCS